MKLGLNFLSEDEKHRIHKDSIKILSQVGVKFLSDKALKILEKNGASVDYDTRIAKMPEEMVTEALKRVPKSFVLGLEIQSSILPCRHHSPATHWMVLQPLPLILTQAKDGMPLHRI